MAQHATGQDVTGHHLAGRWLHTAAPVGGRRRRPMAPSISRRADTLGALLAGVAMALTVGVAWFALEMDGTITSPWVVSGAGLLIGIAVRLGGGPFEPAVRAVISLLVFVVTTLAVSFLVVRYQLREMDPDLPLAFEEHVFVRNRVLAPAYAAASAVGAYLTIQLNYLRARRH